MKPINKKTIDSILKDHNIDNSNTLLMFSGGLDSTGALWELLKNKENKIHLHHLYLLNKEQRAEAEQKAVKNILSYISQSHEVKYSESYHEYPYYSYLSLISANGIVVNQDFMHDSDIYNFIAGTICLSLRKIKTVAIGRTKSDSEEISTMTRAAIGTSILKLLAPNVKKIYPVVHLTKREIYNMLPSELRAMTWSCRTPINIDENTFKECGKCKTCLELETIKNGI
jgi:7-cyano-7-deazaguanine synthase in queuosine biosynthesis